LDNGCGYGFEVLHISDQDESVDTIAANRMLRTATAKQEVEDKQVQCYNCSRPPLNSPAANNKKTAVVVEALDLSYGQTHVSALFSPKFRLITEEGRHVGLPVHPSCSSPTTPDRARTGAAEAKA
jgi:hypothetical protein